MKLGFFFFPICMIIYSLMHSLKKLVNTYLFMPGTVFNIRLYQRWKWRIRDQACAVPGGRDQLTEQGSQTMSSTSDALALPAQFRPMVWGAPKRNWSSGWYSRGQGGMGLASRSSTWVSFSTTLPSLTVKWMRTIYTRPGNDVTTRIPFLRVGHPIRGREGPHFVHWWISLIRETAAAL